MQLVDTWRRRWFRSSSTAMVPKQSTAAPKSYAGWPMPSFFNEDGCKAFGDLELEEDDIIMVSFVKAGTTWVNKIIHCLVRLDESGKPQENLSGSADLGASGQIYPDWLPLEKPTDPEWAGIGPGGMMGKVDFKDLTSQPRPRLFSTHLPAELLPKSLASKGRLIYVMRNPKDCLNSLHYFRGEAKDGWLGNEHGEGSLKRYLSGANAYGSFFDHVPSMQTYIDTKCSDRALVVYYEDLKLNHDEGIATLSKFLGVPLSPEKLKVVRDMTTFSAMSGGTVGKLSTILCRKGVSGDWVNSQLSAEQWSLLDQAFEEKLGNCKIAQPLRAWMVAPPNEGDTVAKSATLESSN